MNKSEYGSKPIKTESTGTKKTISKIIPVTELTPELAYKMIESQGLKKLNQEISKEIVLHHLKQLKAQMGKEKWSDDPDEDTYAYGVQRCMQMIDAKISKINGK